VAAQFNGMNMVEQDFLLTLSELVTC